MNAQIAAAEGGAAVVAERDGEVARLRAQLTAAQAAMSDSTAKAQAALAGARRFMGGTGVARVHFSVRAGDTGGNAVRLLGSVGSLGAWDLSCAVPMRLDGDGKWHTEVVLPSGRVVEYKYVLVAHNGDLRRWQPGADSVLTIYQDESSLEVRDDWSGDPTLCTVATAGGRVEGRQSRLLALLAELRDAFDVLSGDDAAQ
jgi:hypothetical protein